MDKKTELQKAFAYLAEFGFTERRFFRAPDEECVYENGEITIEADLYSGVLPSYEKRMCFDVILTVGERKNILDCAEIFGAQQIAALKSSVENLPAFEQIPIYARFIADNISKLNVTRLYVEIYSKGLYPADALSNFAANAFVMDGVRCASMEGFLQSLKYRSKAKQLRVCALTDKQAKLAGGKKRWWKITGNLYWQGVRYKRNGAQFDALRRRAYESLLNNEQFRAALLAAKGLPLKHSMGGDNKRKTILTKQEFINYLTELYDLL